MKLPRPAGVCCSWWLLHSVARQRLQALPVCGGGHRHNRAVLNAGERGEAAATEAGASTTQMPPFLLYSAAEPSEFALLKQLLQWQQAGCINMQLHTTRTHGLPPVLREAVNKQQQQQQQVPGTAAVQGIGVPQVLPGRICKSQLQAALQQLSNGGSSSRSSSCAGAGVQSGVPDVSAMCVNLHTCPMRLRTLLGLGLPNSSVHSERWW
ncbi:hypothetical protein COO60DRAFT_658230 [Scenedesmus sp. NREL 46B-D3]|nr:hypothetical protein COO60DRAFT_658230 [Scenedesmus sp. NREL 46B-D3]